MTPEQKEAFRREVLEEAAVHLEGRRSVFMRDAAAVLRALAASQPAPAADTGQAVKLTYTNWRGETSERTIVPLSIWFGSTDWHPEPQWLLKAIDTEKGAERDFALKDFGHPVPAVDTGQAVAKARAAVERLANTPMNLSLEDWCVLSADILKGLDAARPAPLDAERVREAAIREAAQIVAKRRDEYVQEHGSYDPSTGVTEFPGDGEELVLEWDEIEEAILALSQKEGK